MTDDLDVDARLRSWGDWARANAEHVPPPTKQVVRTWPTILVAAVIVAVVALTAVAPRLFARHRMSSASQQTVSYTGVFTGADETISDFTLMAPPAGALAKVGIGWQQALAGCQVRGGPLCEAGARTVRVYLANFTRVETGTLSRTIWVLDYRGFRCAPVGGPPSTPGMVSTSPRIFSNCRTVDLIEASTGRFLFAVRTVA
jgi:hypothetical protein